MLRRSLGEALDIEGRLLPALGLLLARPGRLTRAWIEGRQRRYLSPIGLFLLANLAFFLSPPLSDFSVTLRDQLTLQPYSDWMTPWVLAQLAAVGLQGDAAAAAYQARSDELATLLLFVHVPLCAAASRALSFSRTHFMADHLVLWLHFFAFLMLYFALMPWTVLPALRGLDALLPFELPVWPLALSLQLLYMPLMLRGAFAWAWWRCALVGLALLFALYWAHVGYRLVQLVLCVGWLRYAS